MLKIYKSLIVSNLRDLYHTTTYNLYLSYLRKTGKTGEIRKSLIVRHLFFFFFWVRKSLIVNDLFFRIGGAQSYNCLIIRSIKKSPAEAGDRMNISTKLTSELLTPGEIGGGFGVSLGQPTGPVHVSHASPCRSTPDQGS